MITTLWDLPDVLVSPVAYYTSNYFSSFLLSEKSAYRFVDTHINLDVHVCKYISFANYAQIKKPPNSNSFNFLPPSVNLYLNPHYAKDR